MAGVASMTKLFKRIKVGEVERGPCQIVLSAGQVNAKSATTPDTTPG
jgi:hypothetical protein